MIQVKKMVFNNVLYLRRMMLPAEWKKAAIELRRFAIENGFYQTGPFFYQNGSFTQIDAPQTQAREFTIYLPLNTQVKVEAGDGLYFADKVVVERGLSYRQPDSDKPLKSTYGLLLAAAEQNGFSLEPSFYHIFMDVYGEGLLEVFAPIQARDENG